MGNTVITDLINNVRDSFTQLSDGVLNLLPGIIEGIVILILGWIIATIMGKIIGKVIEVIRLDDLLATAGVRGFFQKAGIKLNIDRIFEEVVKWFVLIAFFMSAANSFGLSQVNTFFGEVLDYIPNVLIAVVIAIAGVIIADFVASLAHGAVKATKTGSPTMVAGIVRYAVIIFSLVAILEQLGIGKELVSSFSEGISYAFAGAFALAFGFGGKDVAAGILKKAHKDLQ